MTIKIRQLSYKLFIFAGIVTYVETFIVKDSYLGVLMYLEANIHIHRGKFADSFKIMILGILT